LEYAGWCAAFGIVKSTSLLLYLEEDASVRSLTGLEILSGNRPAWRIDIVLVVLLLLLLARYVGRVSSRFRLSWKDFWLPLRSTTLSATAPYARTWRAVTELAESAKMKP
jgi:hypothetical protein